MALTVWYVVYSLDRYAAYDCSPVRWVLGSNLIPPVAECTCSASPNKQANSDKPDKHQTDVNRLIEDSNQAKFVSLIEAQEIKSPRRPKHLDGILVGMESCRVWPRPARPDPKPSTPIPNP